MAKDLSPKGTVRVHSRGRPSPKLRPHATVGHREGAEMNVPQDNSKRLHAAGGRAEDDGALLDKQLPLELLGLCSSHHHDSFLLADREVELEPELP